MNAALAAAPQTSLNPFGEAQVVSKPNSATTEVEQSRAIAETQAAVAMAKRFPRDPMTAMDRILMACQRPKLAEKATYVYARGGSNITGPSIRLAEAIAQNWGNIQFGIRELDQRNGVSSVEAFAWDMETNTRQTKQFQVKHERHTKQKGVTRLEDPRDIYETVANQGARRLRACILGVIPGDVIEAAVNQAEETLKITTKVDESTLAQMFEKFAALSVTKGMIEKRIQRRIDAITPAQVVSLRGIYNSLQDGMSNITDWFEPDATVDAEVTSKTESVKEQLKTKAAKPAAEATQEPPKESEQIPFPEA